MYDEADAKDQFEIYSIRLQQLRQEYERFSAAAERKKAMYRTFKSDKVKGRPSKIPEFEIRFQLMDKFEKLGKKTRTKEFFTELDRRSDEVGLKRFEVREKYEWVKYIK